MPKKQKKKRKEKELPSVAIQLELHTQMDIKGDQLHQSSNPSFLSSKKRRRKFADLLNTQPHHISTQYPTSKFSLFSHRHTLKFPFLSKKNSPGTKCLFLHGQQPPAAHKTISIQADMRFLRQQPRQEP